MYDNIDGFFDLTDETADDYVNNDIENSNGETTERPLPYNWSSNSLFSAWLRWHPTIPYKLWCIWCRDKSLAIELASVNKHLNTKKHENSVLRKFGDGSPEYAPRRKVAILQLLMCARIAAHDLPFRTVESETLMLKAGITDSDTVRRLNLSRFMVPAILEKIFVPADKERLRNILRNQRFGLIIDESTDISALHTMNVTTRYRDPHFFRIQESLWEVVEIYDDEYSTASGENLYNKMKATFDDEDVPMSNAFAFLSDTPNVMQGSQNSVASRLISFLGEDFLIVPCACHVEHLAAKYACEVLPPYVMQLTKGELKIFNI